MLYFAVAVTSALNICFYVDRDKRTFLQNGGMRIIGITLRPVHLKM